MNLPRWSASVCTLALLSNLVPVCADNPKGLDTLLPTYATKPHGYPAGKIFAQPDESVPFRWHHFHDAAAERFDDARMLPHVDPYNPLDGDGVRVEPKSGVQVRWTAEHRTEGKAALQVDFSADAIQAKKAIVHIRGIAGGQSFSEYLRARNLLHTASCYGPHYRWIKLDAFNPGKTEVRLRVAGVPFRVPAGASTIVVRTNDAVERGYACAFNALPIEVTAPAENVRLFLDNVRMEQELPTVLSKRGRMLQFAGRADAKDPPVVWPGFTNVEANGVYTPEREFGWTQPAKTRQTGGHSFRSMENGLLWGRVSRIDAPLRVDVPNLKWGVYFFGAPGQGYAWAKGMSVKINGKAETLIEPRSDAEVRRMALAGETVDYRPGLCVWESLVRPAYYPAMRVVYAEVTDKHLLIDMPPTLSLHALMIFPADEKDAALQEIGRLNYLLAESWDVSHPWVRGEYAKKVRYIGLHDEMLHPESIPGRFAALKLTDADFERGFVTFQRGLTEPVYPDTIPTPEEAGVKELSILVARGERTVTTLGLLPLRPTPGLRIDVSDLRSPGMSAVISGSSIDVRVSRYHQKCMQFGHHNHDYNYAEHYLVRRPAIDLHRAAVRRVYLDLAVPIDAKPGIYAGTITISSPTGKPLTSLPIKLEVLPFTLVEPNVFLASSLDDPRLKDYGFNTFHTSHDAAVKHGYKGYLANLGYGAVPFQGKPIHWNNVLDQKPLLTPLIDAGQKGNGPRGFFGGIAPGAYGKANGAEISREFYERVRKEYPNIDLLGRTAPAFYFRLNKTGFQVPHEWIVLAAPATPDDPKTLDDAIKQGKEFWYIDGIRHAKEQSGRFTFGFWLWRSGAIGRFTTLEAALQYGGGTARESYQWEPYFTLLDVTTCNVDRALKESLVEGEVNPSRDLILLREGINDYRYVHTLHHRARAKGDKGAQKFLADLCEDLSLDLTAYYEARAGAYGENWTPLANNPWTSEKFTRTRRAIADHVIALQK